VHLLVLVTFAVGAVVAVVVVEQTVRRSDVGAALLLGLILIQEVAFVDLALISAPVRVTPGDVLLVVLLTAATARFLRMERLSVPQRLLVALLVLAGYSVLRGSLLFGMQDSVNGARRTLGFLAAAFYFSTAEPRRELLDRIGWLWLWTAAGLSAIVLVRWAGNAAGLTGGVFGGGGTMRVIGSDETLMLLQGAFISLPLLLASKRGLVRWVGPALLAFVVLLQHRTVWVIAMAGLPYLLFRQRALARGMVIALAASVAVMAVLVVTVLDDAGDGVSEQLAQSAQSEDTFRWRVEGWRMILRDHGPEDPEEVIVGRPFGSSYARSFVPGYVVTVSPHNYYLEGFLRVGAAGVLLLLTLYVIAIRGTTRAARHRVSSDNLLLSPNVLHILVATQLLYYVTYSPNTAQGLLLGLTTAVAVATRDDRSPIARELEMR
jgi:hypothetical protein